MLTAFVAPKKVAAAALLASRHDQGPRRRCCSRRRARCRDRLCAVGRDSLNARVSGVAFAYDPTIPGTVLNGVVVDSVDASFRDTPNAMW